MTAIKFLVDEGSYRYALSGSLLGVELSEIRSVPVGYLSIKETYPLDFEEFILNLGVAQRIIDSVRECWTDCRPVDPVIHEKLLELYRLYTIIGGMPAAVEQYVTTNNLNIVSRTQSDIVALYRKDISQYAEKDKLKIKEILISSRLNLTLKTSASFLNGLTNTQSLTDFRTTFYGLKMQA